jgi:hypothetical protein
MSQHPQQAVHYTPPALNTTDDVTKQNGKHVTIDDDVDVDVDLMVHHQHRPRFFTSPRRSTSGGGRPSKSRSRRNGPLTHVYAVGKECTGPITQNGMKVALATGDKKGRNGGWTLSSTSAPSPADTYTNFLDIRLLHIPWLIWRWSGSVTAFGSRRQRA